MTLASVPRYTPAASDPVGEDAVVVGASMAGLVTARILSDWFDTVTLVERDPLPDDPVIRRGVPQARHPHVLLEAGRTTLEDLFPGFGEALISAGGLLIDVSTDVEYFEQGDYLAQGPNRLPMYTASRPLIEQVVRRRVLDRNGIELRDGCQFTGYLTDDAVTRVDGITIRDRGDRETELRTDLVVDATGRASRTPTWLERNGYDGFDIDWVTIDVAYSTAVIDRPPEDRRVLFVAPDPPRTRGAVAVPIEDQLCQVVLWGVHGDHPPDDPDGLVSFAGDLPVSTFARLLEDRDWRGDEIHRYPFPSSIRNRYEQLDRFPDGLAIVGDAIASYNPIYGQGMSVAALEALVLHHALADGGLTDLPYRFFQRVKPVVDVAWLMSVGSDSQFADTDGPTPRGAGLFNRFMARYIRAAHTDGVLAEAFYRVIMMERNPTSLLAPGALSRVFSPIR